jgi:CRISPR-associated protein (TIGR03986 family)
MYHRDPVEERTSTAAYNFIRLNDMIYEPSWGIPRRDCFDQDLHSGYLTVTLKTLTDLYIRCAPPLDLVRREPDCETTELNRTQPHRQNFFHQGDPTKPAVPGSSFRGAIANLIGILGHARMRDVTDNKLIYRAVADTTSLGQKTYRGLMLDELDSSNHYRYPSLNLKAGYLEEYDGKWHIRPAQKIEVDDIARSFVLAPKGDAETALGTALTNFSVNRVYVQSPTRWTTTNNHGFAHNVTLTHLEATGIQGTKNPGFRSAYLVTPGPTPGHRLWYPAIFDPIKGAGPANCLDVDHLRAAYQNDKQPQRSKTYRTLRPGTAKSPVPLFYLTDESGKVIFFGPSMLFRVPHKLTPRGALPSSHRIGEGTSLDLVETLFGTVREEGENKKPIMSRVSFADLTWQKQPSDPAEGPFVGVKDFKDLLSPKLTAFQQYLSQPEPDGEGTLVHWSSSRRNVRPRGHKAFWHNSRSAYTDDPSRMATKGKPVKKDTEFEGRIHFDNLHLEELGALLMVLELPEGCALKLGMAKPYELGSVKIEKVELALIDRRARYSSLKTSGKRCTQDIQEIKKAAKDAFAAAIRSLYASAETGSLWDDPNIPLISRDLRVMLDFENRPVDEQTATMENGAERWKRRYVLPSPWCVLTDEEDESDVTSDESKAASATPSQGKAIGQEIYPHPVFIRERDGAVFEWDVAKGKKGKRRIGDYHSRGPKGKREGLRVNKLPVQGKWIFTEAE